MSVLDQLSAHYDELEADLEVVANDDFAALVVPNGNHAQPIHRWFHFKEGFSCDLFARLGEELDLSGRSTLRILDPFIGSGTTLLSAVNWAGSHHEVDVIGRGIERNPFLYLLSRAKIEAATTDFDPRELDLVLACAYAKPNKLCDMPPLSTFSDSTYFERQRVLTLVAIRERLLGLSEGLPRRLGLLALAATVEPVSHLRRDGRTLRYAPSKAKVGPAAEFRRRVKVIREDLERDRAFPSSGSSFQVYEGDGRRPALLLNKDFKADLVIFSPPYPNNIDYTEVYKLEAWILGFYESREEFRAQRQRTLRSHPSILFDGTDRLADEAISGMIDSLVEPLRRAIPRDRYAAQRKRMITGYFEDLALTLAEARSVATSSAECVIVVGNSLHGHTPGQLLVAADLLIASLASELGWQPRSLTVARRPVRRSATEPRLRETIITLEAAGKAPAFEVSGAAASR